VEKLGQNKKTFAFQLVMLMLVHAEKMEAPIKGSLKGSEWGLDMTAFMVYMSGLISSSGW
jgi:hypothetical protein